MSEDLIRKYCLEINGLIAGNKKNIELNSDHVRSFLIYLDCIEKWNKTHNIVSCKFSTEDLYDNIVDCVIGGTLLSLKDHVYDVGSGGGFPAIILAIMFPEIKLSLVESSRKKCSFLRVVKNTLNLHNIEIKNQRVESLANLYFITTKAAFSPLNIGLLWEALAKEGQMAIWATLKNRENFISTLGKLGANLVGSWGYELPQGQKRCILLLSKN